MRIALAMLLAVMALFIAPAVKAQAGSCTGWLSTTNPPNYIRVARVSQGRVDRVPFRSYVYHVMPPEWGDSVPYELQKAGAVASKQYAWYWAMHWRGGSLGGHCYDVKDTTADQLYRPSFTVSDRMRRAVDSTWSWTVWRDGRFITTYYTYGQRLPCAYDAGKRLRERSARKCANHGWSAVRILKVYYSAKVRDDSNTYAAAADTHGGRVQLKGIAPPHPWPRLI